MVLFPALVALQRGFYKINSYVTVKKLITRITVGLSLLPKVEANMR